MQRVLNAFKFCKNLKNSMHAIKFFLKLGKQNMNYITGALGIALIVLGFLYKNSLNTIARLEVEKQVIESNVSALDSALTKQNEALRALQVKKEIPEIKEIANIKTIEVIDATCENELKAYKSLFKELGR